MLVTTTNKRHLAVETTTSILSVNLKIISNSRLWQSGLAPVNRYEHDEVVHCDFEDRPLRRSSTPWTNMSATSDHSDSESESDHHHRATPTIDADHLQALAGQVGGHAGVLTTEDGLLIIKPCLPKELEFYNLIAVDERLAPLRPFVPKMYGTLKQMDPAEGAAALAQGEMDPSAVGNLLGQSSKEGGEGTAAVNPQHADEYTLQANSAGSSVNLSPLYNP